MQLEDSPNPAMIDGDVITGLDEPGEFPGGEGMREGEPDDLLLYMGRHTYFDGGLPTRVGQSPVIQEAHEARALKAAPILPQLMIWDARRAALLRERTLALEDGTQPLVACYRFLVGQRVAEKEIKLR
jgi:hypothetical protein